MKKILSIILFLAVIFFLTSGLFEAITKVVVWLVTLQFNSPDISVFGQLVAKDGAWVMTYSLVGIIFNALGWFDSSVMKIVYFAISTIISFLLSWLIMALEKYLWIIAIIVGCLVLILAGAKIVLLIAKKKKTKEEPDRA